MESTKLDPVDSVDSVVVGIRALTHGAKNSLLMVETTENRNSRGRLSGIIASHVSEGIRA